MFVRLVLFLVSPRLLEKSVRGKVVPISVEAVPAGSKPPAAVNMRISTGERHGFGTAAPSLTETSSMRGIVGGLVESSTKLARHIRWGSTFFAEQLSPCFVRPAAACFVRLQILMSVGTSTSVARRGC